MKIGDLVWNEYHGILRFGTVKSKTIKKNGWAHYIVDWHCDEVYENAMKYRESLIHTNHYMTEYRGDLLHLTSRDHLRNIVNCFDGRKDE